MNVSDAISMRTSCRSYDGTKVTPYQEESLLWAATRTPSAGDIHPLTFRAVTNDRLRTILARDASQDWIATAPLIIVILADYQKIERKYLGHGKQYALLEAGHAAQNICLQAIDLGLETCCVGAFRESSVLRDIGIEKSGLTPVYMVVVGRRET